MSRTQRGLYVVLSSLMLSNPAFTADIWVAGAGVGSNSTGDGSSTAPYRTITWAMLQASSGDVIKVKTGTYDTNAGEVFPIDIKHNVDIIGQEASQANWPRIGGDVNVSNSSVEALIRTQAIGSSRTGIDVKKLYFLGEYNSGKDAPSAFVVRVSAGGTAIVNFENNYCERPGMDDSGNADRATVAIDAGYGNSYVTITTCPAIYASLRSGVEVKNGATTGSQIAVLDLDVLRSTIKVTGTDTASYGFAYITSGADTLVPDLTLQGNVVDSSGATGSGGIQTGFYVASAPETGSSLGLNHEHFSVTGNTIKDCTGDGIWLRNVPVDGGSSGYLGLWDFERNIVRGCDGSALFIQKTDSTAYSGYVTVQSRGNLLVKNGRAITVEADTDAGGNMVFINDTIADNSSYGLQLLGDEAWIRGMVNCIVYGNYGGNLEYDPGTSNWSPIADGVTVEYCDFEGLTCGEGNVTSNWDPKFVNAAANNYHLNAALSPCIDAGDNSPDEGTGTLLAEFDFDGDDRMIDGDEDSEIIIDMGADEHDP